MIDDGDLRVVQLVSAGLVACGLLVTVGSSLMFSSGSKVGKITAENMLSWSPRGFCGSGPPGKSPVFGVMWSSIYLSQLYFSIVLLITALQNSVFHDQVALFTACACVFSSTTIAAFWTPVFTSNTKTGFVLASILLISCATIATIGAVAGKPFLNPEFDDPLIDAGLTFISFFAGWTLVASGLSIGITVRAYDRGVGAKSTDAEDAVSFFPLALSVLAAVVAILFAVPVLPLPLLIALFFVKDLFKRWTLWIAAIVSVVGIVVGIVMVFLYTGSGPWW